MTIFIEIFFVFGLVSCLYFFYRNSLVHRFRLSILEQIYDRSDWKYQCEIFETVTYQEMLYKFWKPLTIESFYGEGSDLLDWD